MKTSNHPENSECLDQHSSKSKKSKDKKTKREEKYLQKIELKKAKCEKRRQKKIEPQRIKTLKAKNCKYLQKIIPYSHVSPDNTDTSSLTFDEQKLLEEYMLNISYHIVLTKKERSDMLSDFKKAVMKLYTEGTPLESILERFPPERLGGFYARPANNEWFPLDYAARTYPLSMKRNQMAIFRLSVYLKEDISPELLQIALIYTITRFPSFATTVKNGFFWHYLNVTKRRFIITEETLPPFRPITLSETGSQSFRVLYYKNRISVEFFHALTDGTGGMIFLKTLTSEYLRLCGFDIPCTGGILDINDTPSKAELSNDFPKVNLEPSDDNQGLIESPGVHMGGELSHMIPCRIFHFNMNTDELLALTKSKGASITAYLLSQMFVANKFATDARTGTIKIQIPVNMRKFYDSITVRNFSMFVNIAVPIDRITDADSIMSDVSVQLKKRASKQDLNKLMLSTVDMTNKLRYVPLMFKRLAAKVFYHFSGDNMFSNTLSNLVTVKCPVQMAEQIDKFDFVLCPGGNSRASCGLISFENKSVFTITKTTTDPSFEEKLLQLLRNDGLTVNVEGSELYEAR